MVSEVITSGKQLRQRGLKLAESKEWFTREDMGEYRGTKAHDVHTHIKNNGYILEEKREGRIKLYRWTGEKQQVGARTGAQQKAAKLLPKPPFCPLTGISKRFTVGHKDGRCLENNEDVDPNILTKENVADYFQWESSNGNAMKREACRRCAKTNIKDPARVGSMSIGQGAYEGTCKGCYWYDPRAWFESKGICE